MRTGKAAERLGISEPRVRQLIGSGDLKAEKMGPRLWNVDPDSVEAYKLKRDGREQIGEKEPASPGTAQASSERVSAVSDAQVGELIEDLEQDGIAVAGNFASMARLFWWLSDFLLAGMEPGSIFPTAMAMLPKGAPDGGAKASNYVSSELMFKLRLLRLVKDENRTRGQRGYTVVVCTELGAMVVQALVARKWPRPRI